MSYKIAGIDVHKKVLMVVVMDAHAPADRRRVDPEFCPEGGTAYLAQHDPDEDAAHPGPSAFAESDGVSAGGDAHQAVQCSQRSIGCQRTSYSVGLGPRGERPKEIGRLGRRALAVQRGATYRCFDRKPAADAPGTALVATGTAAIDR